ncbi:hypothetical protein NPX13_g2046 [Xylaria arbuscula]|uniref:Uncharacterized protein n=1 Tax=Xylaria arbuscula TaxID=114810 RepID=A0A9W8NKJ1_9PEZI|nr:hypothetical protein NPX13_g2046 [Xylaria arbuscula]
MKRTSPSENPGTQPIVGMQIKPEESVACFKMFDHRLLIRLINFDCFCYTARDELSHGLTRTAGWPQPSKPQDLKPMRARMVNQGAEAHPTAHLFCSKYS